MPLLIDPDSYNDVVFKYGLTSLYGGADLQIQDGDLALTKDGDLRLGAVPFNSMLRLVQSWRYNAPAMRLMFDTIAELQNAKPGLERDREEILARGPKQAGFLPSEAVQPYHAANDAIGATEVSQAALAGSLLIVNATLLGRFKDDLGVSVSNWNNGTPSFAKYSLGQVVVAAANSFRHADEWKKALFAKKTTSQQQISMTVIEAVLGLDTDYDLFHTHNLCGKVVDLISGKDFDQLARSTLTFANSLVAFGKQAHRQ